MELLLTELSAHEFTKFLPIADPQEIAMMETSILKEGQLEPIIIFENRILDGRARYQILKKHGLKVLWEKYEGDPQAAAKFVVIKNIHRRHLEPYQRAFAALDYRDGIMEEFKKRKYTKGEGNGQRSSEAAATLFGVSRCMVDYAHAVRNSPVLLQKVLTKQITLTQAYHLLSDKKPRRGNITTEKRQESLSVLHKKLQQGFKFQMQLSREAFQCHAWGNGIAPLRSPTDWSSKPTFERFYEAVFSECEKL